jgi:hypothetical protein
MQIFSEKVEMLCHKTCFDLLLHSFCAQKNDIYLNCSSDENKRPHS